MDVVKLEDAERVLMIGNHIIDVWTEGIPETSAKQKLPLRIPLCQRNSAIQNNLWSRMRTVRYVPSFFSFLIVGTSATATLEASVFNMEGASKLEKASTCREMILFQSIE